MIFIKKSVVFLMFFSDLSWRLGKKKKEKKKIDQYLKETCES